MNLTSHFHFHFFACGCGFKYLSKNSSVRFEVVIWFSFFTRGYTKKLILIYQHNFSDMLAALHQGMRFSRFRKRKGFINNRFKFSGFY